jgi:RHS repeat-associated protein
MHDTARTPNELRATQPQTKARAPEDTSFRITPPAVTLPKGGGAIRGLGEKFSANPVTGTGSIRVPLATTPGRGGFGPQLALSYDSGGANGPFGIGWSLSLPSITRRTDKGLPTYRDEEESDVFVLFGAEDLVPAFKQVDGEWELDADGKPVIDETTHDFAAGSYRVRRYRPRIEQAFTHIERCTNVNDPADVFWRAISRDNLTNVYGRSRDSRIFDPSDSRRIFSWLICESYDDNGNVITYDYVPEDDVNVGAGSSNERNRIRTANRYLKRIRYGNTPSRRMPNFATDVVWHFEVQVDYGQEDYREDLPLADGSIDAFVRTPHPPVVNWPSRLDPFSSYRSGFEVRTYRLCRRVLMFHRFDELLGSEPQLVSSTEFAYAEHPIASQLVSVTRAGFVPSGETVTERRYVKRCLPPVEFTYSKVEIDHTVRDVDAESLENLPTGLNQPDYKWIDLESEGISGILTEQGDEWFYKRNLAPINLESDATGALRARAKFAPIELVATKPNATVGATQFMDLDGNGQIDLVAFNGPTPGFYEHDGETGWLPFRPFVQELNRRFRDSNLQLVDLDGDGRADVLITEDEAITWHQSLGVEGFAPARRVATLRDEELGPVLVFADSAQSIYLADMSGDGLTDLVRIRNGEVCFWPNIGYGAFGAKVAMDGAPWFDAPDTFDQRRIRLADIDGSGVTDIIYLHGDGPVLYFNQAGNRWSEPRPLRGLPHIDDISSVTVADLLGNGTACLIWSSSRPADARRPMKYVDLMSGQKPYLLVGIRNNLGAETTIEYAPSTRFYLQDWLAGRKWITRLPFPVHCVVKVSVVDRWRRATFSSTYSYHHGYFDGKEREFRGFGRVEQIDTEDFGTVAARNGASPWITGDLALHQPPVKTITWFHTGAAIDSHRILTQFQHEYFPHAVAARPSGITLDGFFTEKPLIEPDLTSLDLSTEEWREALRACKGTMLRQEVYELDVRALGERPSREIPVRLFSAGTHTCGVQRLQPRATNRHAVFLTTESETLSYHYELDLRGTAPLEPDPRITHTLNLSFDDLGNVQQSIAIGYPRPRQFDEADLTEHFDLIREVQRERHMTYVETHYTNDVIDEAAGAPPVQQHRLRAPCEVDTYDVTGITPTAGTYFDLVALRKWAFSTRYPATAPPTPIARKPYHDLPQTTAPTMRLIERGRTLFFDDDENGPDAATRFLKLPLALGTLGKLGLVYQQYRLALTKDLLDAVFVGGQLEDGRPDGTSVLDTLRDSSKSGYVRGSHFFDMPPAGVDDEYWMCSGVAGFDDHAPEHFYLPNRYFDSFSKLTTLTYDGKYDFFVRSTTDPLNNITRIEDFDYRVFAPSEQIDPSGNYTAAAFDSLGMTVGVAVMGKQRTESGDTLNALVRDIPLTDIESFFTQPYAGNRPVQWIANATSRFVYDLGEHVAANGATTYGHRPAAACGIVREKHVNAGGPVRLQLGIEYSDGLSTVLVRKTQAEPDPDSQLLDPPLRWIATGKTVLNNKGNAVKQYEPYFSREEHRFDPAEAENNVGVTPVMYYDATGRVVRTELPDGSFSRVEFSPWHVTTFDANDTVGEPNNEWRAQRTAPRGTTEDRRAAGLALVHHNTPARTVLDSLGRDVIAIAHNRIEDSNGTYTTNGRTYRNEYHLTYTKHDCEGQALWIRDARGNLVVQSLLPPKPDRDEPRIVRDFTPNGNPHNDIGQRVPAYDLAGNLLFQRSADAGDRWTLNDAAGSAMFAWDVNDYRDTNSNSADEHRMLFVEYDELHRPTKTWLRLDDNAPTMIGLVEYQDGQLNDPSNLNGQPIRHYDLSGRLATVRRDFDGNVREVNRRLNNQPAQPLIDWQSTPENFLDTDTFTKITEYDALNRITRQYSWHLGNGARVAVYTPEYNERGLLAKETLVIRARKTAAGSNAAADTETHEAIKRIHYDVKSQKTLFEAGNGTITRYDYDPLSFRLRQLRTTRITAGQVEPSFPDAESNLGDGRTRQQLHYTYDPSGNVMEIYDEAYQPVFFQNQVVEPRNAYEYDALYRLVSASGREQGALTGAPTLPEIQELLTAFPITDPNAQRNYTQTFQYDRAGNILRIHHAAGLGTWTRRFRCADDSNRLLATWDADDDWQNVNQTIVTGYDYDRHGNMLNVVKTAPRFNLRWDPRDMVRHIDLGGGGQAYYQYDADKQRTRKRIERRIVAPGGTERWVADWERIDLGGFERYRRYDGTGTNVVEEIESHHLSDGRQRVLLVDDVIDTNRTHANGTPYRRGPILRYQYSNHLGSVCLELDDHAAIISYEEYHPYGTSAFRAMTQDIEAPPKRYRYTGMERDEESGFTYHTARFCVPNLGRWISIDPSGTEGGLNLYAYAGGNPLKYLDSSGRGLKATEEFSVKPQIRGALEAAEWLFSEEVAFDFTDPETGKVYKNLRLDFGIRDPAGPAQEGALFGAEAKGAEISSPREGQARFLELLQRGIAVEVDITSLKQNSVGFVAGDKVTFQLGKNFVIIYEGNLADFKAAVEQMGQPKQPTILKHIGGKTETISFPSEQALLEHLAQSGDRPAQAVLEQRGTPGKAGGFATPEGVGLVFGIALTAYALVQTNKYLDEAADRAVAEDNPDIYFEALNETTAAWGGGLGPSIAWGEAGAVLGAAKLGPWGGLGGGLLFGLVIAAISGYMTRRSAIEEIKREKRARNDPEFAAKWRHWRDLPVGGFSY